MSTTALALLVLATSGAAPSQSGAATVTMKVDTFDRTPISRFVYGVNFPESRSTWGTRMPVGITLSRFGGNRISAYNWENNASNCGNDCGDAFSNDAFLGGGSEPGEAVRSRAAWAFAHGAGFLVSVPMLGWVAADKDGRVPLRTPLEQRRATRFKVSKARKGLPQAASPDRSDGFVYQDEFVSWLQRSFPAAADDPLRPIFYSLDNEPDLWGSTHEEVRGDRLGKDRYVLTGYEELVRLTVEYASMLKEVTPRALVFGPALSTWNGFANLYHNEEPDPAGKQFFLEYYLDGLRKVEAARGRRLLDVLDVHWYSEATSAHYQSVANEWADQDAAMVQARVQAPRSLWDPSFRERSWVAKVVGGPVRLIPRLKEMISAHYPGTKLAITEYYFHRGGDISGAVAQADALGIFGREGVFAATLWPQGAIWAYHGDTDRTYACALAAFRSYRDYDGRGGAFGDVSLQATTSDVERTSLYASAVAGDASRLVLVALNKSPFPVEASVAIATALSYSQVEVWQLTGQVGSCTGPVRVAPDVPVRAGTFTVQLPPLSVSTLVVR